MIHGLRTGASALIIALAAGSLPAFADFWSDAGAKFQGVTLHGVTENAPPSTYVLLQRPCRPRTYSLPVI